MTAEEYFEQGNECYNEGDYNKSIEYYNKAIELNPNSVSAYVNRGISKDALKDFKAAIEDYDKAIELDSSTVIAYINRGNSKNDLKDFQGAIEDYDIAIELDSNSMIAYINRGISKSELKDFEGAIEDYDKVIELEPDCVFAYINRGNSKSELKDFEGAIEDYDKAIELEPNFVYVYFNRGLSKDELKDYEGAIQDFDKVLTLDPNHVFAYNGKGNSKSELKDFEGAIENYSKAIALDPKYVIAYYNRGNSKSELKDFEGAIENYDKALALDPNYFEAYNNRGDSKTELKEYEGAIKDYNIAILLNQHYADSWQGKCIVYIYQNHYELALNCLLRASFLGLNTFNNQSILYEKHSAFPFFIFRQIQSNLDPNEYNLFTDTINSSWKACLPFYTFITKKAITNNNRNYDKTIWQRWLGNVNYYCGDPLISHSIFKSFVDENSNTLSDYYYLIQSCFDFVEDADLYIGKVISIAEKVKDADYIHPAASNPYLHYPLLQQYYAGLIFEIDEEPEDALVCFEKIASHFLPAKYKQMQLLYDLDKKEASENIRQEILKLEEGLSNKTSFLRGLAKHTFNLNEDRVEKLFPHYFHYLEIEPAITHLVNLSKEEIDFELQYPGNQPNFWELFRVNPEDLDATRKHANVVPLIAQYKSQIEEYGSSFNPNNKPESIQEDNTFRQIFKSLDAIDNKAELQLELGLNIQEFKLPAEQYEELSTYFFVKGYLNNYEKLMLDFYALAKQLSTKEKSPALVAGLGKVIQSFIGKYLGLTVAAVSGVLNFPPLAAAFIGVVSQAGVNFTAASLAALFKSYYSKSKNLTVENFQLFKAGFEQFIGEEKERLGNQFEKKYPLEKLYK